MRHVIRATTDPDRKKREKDERKEAKLRQKERNKQSNAKLNEKINAPFRGIPGAIVPAVDRSDRVGGYPPPPKGFDIFSMSESFRARIKTRHKTSVGLHRTLAVTYDEKGDIFEFEPAIGGMVIYGYVQLEYGDENVTKAYWHIREVDQTLTLTVTPETVPPTVFVIAPEKKQLVIRQKDTNKLLCAEDHALKANKDKVGAWEKFSLTHPKEKEDIWAVHVRTEYTGLHQFTAGLRARRHNKKGGVGVDEEQVGFSKNNADWLFTPNAACNAYTIKNAALGSYLSVDANDTVTLSVDPGEWNVEGDWNGTVALRWVATGKLAYAEKKDIKCNKTKKGEWETFELIR